jgi:hypothetical protein
MGNTTHGKKKMPGLSSSTKLTVPPAEVKKEWRKSEGLSGLGC